MTDKQAEWLKAGVRKYIAAGENKCDGPTRLAHLVSESYWQGRRAAFTMVLDTLAVMPSAEELEKEEGDKCK